MPQQKKWKGRAGPGRGHQSSRSTRALQPISKIVNKCSLSQPASNVPVTCAPSSNTPAVKSGKGRPALYKLDDRILFALMLGKHSISSHAGVMVHRFVRKLPKAASPHTALRSLVEAHVCCELEIARLLAISTGLFIGIDGSSTEMQAPSLRLSLVD